jgi:hypothetical protein
VGLTEDDSVWNQSPDLARERVKFLGGEARIAEREGDKETLETIRGLLSHKATDILSGDLTAGADNQTQEEIKQLLQEMNDHLRTMAQRPQPADPPVTVGSHTDQR